MDNYYGGDGSAGCWAALLFMFAVFLGVCGASFVLFW